MEEQMPQDAAPQEGGAQDAAGQVGQLVSDINGALGMFLQTMDAVEGTPDELKQRMAGVVQEFQSIVQDLAGGGEAAAPEQAEGGVSPVRSARQGVPMGPQGAV